MSGMVSTQSTERPVAAVDRARGAPTCGTPVCKGVSMSQRAQELAAVWGLDLDAMARDYGDWNQILFVHRGGTPYVLKLTGDGHSAADEAAALAAWDGDGAVRLIAQAPDARLLERLDPDQSVASLPLADALPIHADLVRRLCVPAPEGLPRLVSTAASVAELPDLPAEVL